MSIICDYLPKIDLIIILPTLRSRPAFDVGMPVLRAICCFALETPSARFHEKDNPGIFIIVAIIVELFYNSDYKSGTSNYNFQLSCYAADSGVVEFVEPHLLKERVYTVFGKLIVKFELRVDKFEQLAVDFLVEAFTDVIS